VINHQPPGVQLKIGVGQHPLDGLVGGERAAERLAIGGVLRGNLQRALGDSRPAHTVSQPGRAEAPESA
jgi:hypothetical protein